MTDIDGQALMFGATYRVTTEFSENNSGGTWWMGWREYAALEAAGWVKSGDHHLSDGCVRGREYTIEVHALSIEEARRIGTERAIKSWSDAVGQDPDTTGCTCCGPPFRFMDWLDPEMLTGNVAVTGDPDSGTVDRVVEILRGNGAEISVDDVMKMRADLFGKGGD